MVKNLSKEREWINQKWSWESKTCIRIKKGWAKELHPSKDLLRVRNSPIKRETQIAKFLKKAWKILKNIEMKEEKDDNFSYLFIIQLIYAKKWDAADIGNLWLHI